MSFLIKYGVMEKRKKDNRMSNLIDIANLAVSLKKVQSVRDEGVYQSYDTAIILHLYYNDLWEEIRPYLGNLCSCFDLLVSVCDTTADFIQELIKQHYPDVFLKSLCI